MNKLMVLLTLLTLSSSAFAKLQVACSGPDKSGRTLSFTVYTPGLKTKDIPDYPGARYYMNIVADGKTAVYALTAGQLLTGHFMVGTDFGPLKSVQTFQTGKEWTGTLNHVRFGYENCNVLVLEPETH